MNNSSLYRIAMQYGAYSGLSNFIFFLGMYFITSNPLGGMSWLGFWIPIVFIVLAIKQHRDSNLGGFINYWPAVGTGVLVAVFASLLYAIMVYLFGTLADSGIIETFKAEQLAKIEEGREHVSSEFLNEMMDKAVEEIQGTSLVKMSRGVVFNGVIWGAVISLITGAILRKYKPFFDEPDANSPAQ